MIENSLDQYQRAKNKVQRSTIVSEIIESVVGRQGMFVRQDPKTKRWFQVDTRTTREKVGQAIRAAMKKREDYKSKSASPKSEPRSLSNQSFDEGKLEAIDETSERMTSTQRGSPCANVHQFSNHLDWSDSGSTTRHSAGFDRVRLENNSRLRSFAGSTGTMGEETTALAPETFHPGDSVLLPGNNAYRSDRSVYGGLTWLERHLLHDGGNVFNAGYAVPDSSVLRSVPRHSGPPQHWAAEAQQGTSSLRSVHNTRRLPFHMQLAGQRRTPLYPEEAHYLSPVPSPDVIVQDSSYISQMEPQTQRASVSGGRIPTANRRATTSPRREGSSPFSLLGFRGDAAEDAPPGADQGSNLK